MKYEWRAISGMTLLTSLTLSKTKDNGAQSLENNNGNFPAPQDYCNLGARYGISGYHQPYNSTTSFIRAAAVRPRPSVRGLDVSKAVDVLIGGWQIAGINTVTPASR
jgi:hypothetical protein